MKMERLPKRRGLSLSLSQQGKERSRRKRNCNSARSFDSSSQDIGKPVTKDLRSSSEKMSQDVSDLSDIKKPLNSDTLKSTPEIITENLQGKDSFERTQMNVKDIFVTSMVDKDAEQIDFFDEVCSLVPSPLSHNENEKLLNTQNESAGMIKVISDEFCSLATDVCESGFGKAEAALQSQSHLVTVNPESSKITEARKPISKLSKNDCIDNPKKLVSEEPLSKTDGDDVALDSGALQSVQCSDEEQDILQCPVCFKNFDKKCSKSAHLKGCAMKHGMTTKQLLDALDLQKRQAAERKALGLPALLKVPQKLKKPVSSRKDKVNKMDSGLQLALALSLSLRDQEQSTSYRQSMQGNGTSLESFGFVSKPVLESVQSHQVGTASKGKAKSSVKKVPVLLTRTAEERQQITTEKVAMVLMEEIDLTEENNASPVRLVSDLLQGCHIKDKPLWEKSQLSPSKADRGSFYVKELRSFISPTKEETGSKVKHLSQIAGRIRTPEKEKNSSGNTIAEDFKRVLVPSITLSDDNSSSDSGSASSKIISSLKCDHSTSLSLPKVEAELRAKLFNDWAGMVNNSSMSDMIIYPQEGRDIHSHKLLLLVRCPEMLHDIVKQHDPVTGNEVEVIAWPKIPHAAALAFLEYVYCGSVKTIPALGDDLSSIKWLSSRYKAFYLLKYLKAISNTRLPPSQEAVIAVHDLENSNSHPVDSADSAFPDRSPDQSNKEEETPYLPAKEFELGTVLKRLSRDNTQSPAVSEVDSIYSCQTLVESHCRSLSPDLFEDGLDEVSLSKNTTPQSRHSPNGIGLSEKNIKDGDSPERPSSCRLSTCSESTVIQRENSPLSFVDISESALPKESNPKLDCLFDTSCNALDPKRKLSNNSDEDDESLRKRLCSQNIKAKGFSQKDLGADLPCNVELYDLTQDSNSGSNSLNRSRRSSKDSCESVVISSDIEPLTSNVFSSEKNVTLTNTDHEDNNVSPSNPDLDLFEESPKQPERKCNALEESHLSNVELLLSPAAEIEPMPEELNSSQQHSNALDQSRQPYISPVWDGFEDLNYDEPCMLTSMRDIETVSTKAMNLSGTPSHSDLPSSENRSMCEKSATANCEESGKNNLRSSCVSNNKDDASTKSSHSQEEASHSFGVLLDDSFNNVFSDSMIQRAEKECNGISNITPNSVIGTPISHRVVEDIVTPMANYSAMKTPDLKKEMKKFGLKPSLGKRKGKIMLRHIYNELHPWVPVPDKKSYSETSSLSQPQSSTRIQSHSLSQPSTSKKQIFPSDSELRETNLAQTQNLESGDESDSSSCHSRHEGSFLEDCKNEFEPLSQAVSKCAENNLWSNVQDIIRSDPQLHQKVLEYEPIWIEKFHSDLRSKGIKVKMADLMALLDEKCITFRTVQSGSRVRKKKGNKNTPKKKPTESMDEAELSIV